MLVCGMFCFVLIFLKDVESTDAVLLSEPFTCVEVCAEPMSLAEAILYTHQTLAISVFSLMPSSFHKSSNLEERLLISKTVLLS